MSDVAVVQKAPIEMVSGINSPTFSVQPKKTDHVLTYFCGSTKRCHKIVTALVMIRMTGSLKRTRSCD